MKTWHILYRGSLSSCNYECAYCPFAKTANTAADLKQDQSELERFAAWVGVQSNRIGLLFTPWGEALIHRHYRRTLVALSHLPHVYRVSIQTNLSTPIEDLKRANRQTLGLWATYHPSQTTLQSFLNRCSELDAANIRYTVGVVGLKEHFEAIRMLRSALRPEVYVWVNAFKKQPDYYSRSDIDALSAIDPYFSWNLNTYPSLGKQCAAGETGFTVDGNGAIRRCHFISTIVGNIYDQDFCATLTPRACTVQKCGCYIGYIHRGDLGFSDLYGDGILHRSPHAWPTIDERFAAPSRSQCESFT